MLYEHEKRIESLLSPEQASALTGIPARLIYRWVEAGTIHYREAANGKLAVCLKTLLEKERRSGK